MVDMYNRFDDPKHIRWAKAVKERDCFECQVCGENGGFLHSHHMNSFDVFVEERFDVENGVTLCKSCHHRFHNIYGLSCNTKYQFTEFKTMIDSIRKVAREI